MGVSPQTARTKPVTHKNVKFLVYSRGLSFLLPRWLLKPERMWRTLMLQKMMHYVARRTCIWRLNVVVAVLTLTPFTLAADAKLDALLDKANHGDAHAQLSLAVKYRDGRGVEKDP